MVIPLSIDTCGVLGGIALGSFEEPASQVRDAGLPNSQESEKAKVSPQSTRSYLEHSQSLGHPDLLGFRELAGKTYSERLIATIAELLGEAGVALSQISGIVVVHGPGSFTGIRIGVSAAKGLAEALAVPLIAVSRLELLARQAGGVGAVAVLDAGRGEFYVGIYRCDARGGYLREAELLLTQRAEVARAATDSGLPVVVCEDKLLDVLGEVGARRVVPPTAVEALTVGWERFRARKFDDVASLDANYLRRPETEMLARIAEHAASRAAALER